MPRRIFRSRAYQLAQEPESLVITARSGSRDDNSQVTRCGLTGFAGCRARSSSVFHQSLTLPSMEFRQAWSGFCWSRGSSARKVSLASPTRPTSMGKRIDSSPASISIWTPRALPSLGKKFGIGKGRADHQKGVALHH
jgi:hypothetical protein